MELVYLWVEKYKNIEKQGFNFSPRFRCEYNPVTNELEIEENEAYIENFFGKNIQVTAIVGKNGSGKSSLLRELTWQHILININNTFYASGFKKNDFNNLTEDYYNNILYVNYDLMLPSEFDCFACHQAYPSNKNLYKLIENSESLKNKFDSERFYQNFQALIIEYSKILNTKNRIFSYIPKYVKIHIHGNNDWQNKLSTQIEHENIENFIEFLEKNKNSKIEIELFKEDFFKYKNLFSNPKNSLVNIEIYDDFDRNYFSLSQGERKVFTELLMIYDAIYKHKSNDLFLILDEPDLTLHPNWQKKYFNELISILKVLEKNIHLIITTHSPFLLSDIPKQNIIFLDTYNKNDEEVKSGKQQVGNCKVVDGLNEKEETFGANIHTLLSDGFFMEDGLMGEFAKEKINNLIAYLNGGTSEIKNNDEAQKLIDIIGEPIIQRQLQQQLDTKNKDAEITALQEEIKQLKEQISQGKS